MDGRGGLRFWKGAAEKLLLLNLQRWKAESGAYTSAWHADNGRKVCVAVDHFINEELHPSRREKRQNAGVRKEQRNKKTDQNKLFLLLFVTTKCLRSSDKI